MIVVILVRYRTLLLRHFLLSEHWFFVIQLHVLATSSFGFNVVFVEQLVKFVVSREVLIT